MTPSPHHARDVLKSLRAAALRYPEAEEGIACKGTALEKRTIKARNKAFLFLGTTDAMLKLGASVAEATQLAAKDPGRYKVGKTGWVTVSLGPDGGAPIDLLERWVDESYRLIAPKQLVAMLPDRGAPAPVMARKKAARS